MRSNDFNGEELSEFELIILKKLAKKLRIDEKEVVEAIKALIKKRYIIYKSKLIGGEFKLTRKGYDTLAKYGSGISLKSLVKEDTKVPTIQSNVTKKSDSKIMKIIISLIVLFFIIIMVVPRLPMLFTAIGGESGIIKPLEIKVASFSVKSIDMSGLKGSIYFKVYNPNIIPAIIDKITYNIYDKDGNLLAQGEIPRTYTVPAQSSITIQNDISIGWTGALYIIKNKIEEWITGEKEEWTIDGLIYVNIGITTLKVPFTTTFKV
ncbi:LEA type 2 family protein [Archaeoglobus sp.]